MDKASRETVPECNIQSRTLLTPGSSPRAKKKKAWEVSMYHLRLCFISTHTFWLHKTRQDTFSFTSFMDFISLHDLHVSISIHLYIHMAVIFKYFI